MFFGEGCTYQDPRWSSDVPNKLEKKPYVSFCTHIEHTGTNKKYCEKSSCPLFKPVNLTKTSVNP